MRGARVDEDVVEAAEEDLKRTCNLCLEMQV
jgi:hypothetical protein